MVDDDFTHRKKMDGSAAVGYLYDSNEPWRHELILGSYQRSDPEYSSEQAFRGAVIAMAHELGMYRLSTAGSSQSLRYSGHVAGLLHEHQRPDANQYIDIAWQNMRGFDEAATAVEASNDPRFDGLDKDQRMRRVCVIISSVLQTSC